MAERALFPTPIRRRLLRDVDEGDVYQEAGHAWSRSLGYRRTHAMVEFARAGWVVRVADTLPGREVYRLTDAGKAVMGDG